jgi:hypothetical protein
MTVINCRLLAKLQVDASLSVNRTGMGFNLVTGSGDPVVYKGKIHQKKIAKFLQGLGVEVGA